MGRSAAATAAIAASEQAAEEFLATVPEAGPRRALLAQATPAWRARLQLLLGDNPASLNTANQVLAQLRAVEVPADDQLALRTRDNLVRFALITSATAAVQLGRYAEAEAASRERLALPPNLDANADPQDETSRATILLAHAMAAQGRGAEALELLGPVLDGYRAEQRAGAGGTRFQRDLAYALFVEAIAQPADATGRARRATVLAAAQREFDALSSEVRQESDVRDLGAGIASARAAAAEAVYGSLRQGPEPPRVTAKEPPQQGERRVEVRREAQLPFPVMLYHAPNWESPECYALEGVARVLSHGRSSRLYQRLVYKERLALDAGADYDLDTANPAAFALYGQPLPGKTVPQIEKALDEEVQRLESELVGPKELEKVKNQVTAGFFMSLDSLFFRVMLLGRLATVANWTLAREFVPKFQAVTAEEIRQVAKKYLSRDKRPRGTGGRFRAAKRGRVGGGRRQV